MERKRCSCASSCRRFGHGLGSKSVSLVVRARRPRPGCNGLGSKCSIPQGEDPGPDPVMMVSAGIDDQESGARTPKENWPMSPRRAKRARKMKRSHEMAWPLLEVTAQHAVALIFITNHHEPIAPIIMANNG